jgi:hypothetical protein
MKDNELQNMLNEIDEPIGDAGFTEAVLQGLPRVRQARRRMDLLIVAYLLGCAVVAALFPMERAVAAVVLVLSTPWLIGACTLTLSLLSWLLARRRVSI